MSRIVRVAILTSLVYRQEVDVDLDDPNFDWIEDYDDRALEKALSEDIDETDSMMDAIARQAWKDHFDSNDVYDAERYVQVVSGLPIEELQS
jgi:hypothetical protein